MSRTNMESLTDFLASDAGQHVHWTDLMILATRKCAADGYNAKAFANLAQYSFDLGWPDTGVGFPLA